MTPKPRGFAALTPERRREIAAKGGRATVGQPRGFAVSSEKAKEAGRKGGLISRKKPLTPSE